MKKITTLLLTTSILIFSSILTFAQTPDFSGTWILNLGKSRLENKTDGLTSSIFIIKQNGDKLNLTRYHLFGEKKKKIGFKMIADAKTRRVKILFNGKLEKKENGLLAALWRKNFLNIVEYKFGTTQNEFVADEIFKGKLQSYHNIWVFDRKIPK